MHKLSTYPPMLMPTDGKCPICGRVIDKRLIHCWFCHQKFYDYSNLPLSNNDVLYITITTFIGWVGKGPSFQIAFDVVSKEYSAIKNNPKDNLDIPITFSKRMIYKLCKHYKQLFHCEEIQNNRIQACDCSTYYVRIRKGEETFKLSVYDYLVEKWPLFNMIVYELEGRKWYERWIRKILKKLEG